MPDSDSPEGGSKIVKRALRGLIETKMRQRARNNARHIREAREAEAAQSIGDVAKKIGENTSGKKDPTTSFKIGVRLKPGARQFTAEVIRPDCVKCGGEGSRISKGKKRMTCEDCGGSGKQAQS